MFGYLQLSSRIILLRVCSKGISQPYAVAAETAARTAETNAGNFFHDAAVSFGVRDILRKRAHGARSTSRRCSELWDNGKDCRILREVCSGRAFGRIHTIVRHAHCADSAASRHHGFASLSVLRYEKASAFSIMNYITELKNLLRANHGPGAHFVHTPELP